MPVNKKEKELELLKVQLEHKLLKEKYEERKEKQRIANKRYTHKRRANELGISLEEYEEKYCNRGRPIKIESFVIDLSGESFKEPEPEPEPVVVVEEIKIKKKIGRPRKQKL